MYVYMYVSTVYALYICPIKLNSVISYQKYLVQLKHLIVLMSSSITMQRNLVKIYASII